MVLKKEIDFVSHLNLADMMFLRLSLDFRIILSAFLFFVGLFRRFSSSVVPEIGWWANLVGHRRRRGKARLS